MQVSGLPFLRTRHLPRLILWCGGGLIAALIALFGGAIVWLHDQAIAEAESRLAQLNLVLAEQSERSFGAIDTVLDTVASVARRGDLFKPDMRDRIQAYLASQSEALPQARAFVVMDSNGDLAIDSTSRLTRAYNGADRENFQFLQRRDGYFHIALPLLGRLSGEWLFTISRRLENPDGSFAGIIASTIDLGYFTRFYEAVKLGDDALISLWRDDGGMLVSWPFAADRLARHYPRMRAVAAGIANGEGVAVQGESPLDAQERLMAFRKLKDYPAFMVVSRTRDGVLAAWREKAFAIAAFGVAAILVLAGLGAVLLAMARAQEGLLLSAYEARAHAEYASKLAERANRQKTKFFSAVSHDLRTPLCTISGFSDLLLAGHAGALSDKARDYAQNIQSCGKYLLELLNDLLDMGKIEAGRLTLTDDEFALRSVVLDCLRQSAALAMASRVALAPYEERAFGLRADPLRLRQILLNLLSNAVKFTPAGGRVEVVTALAADGGLRISVIDSGIGMSREEVATALEPYGQVSNDFTRRRDGTGLGLPLVKALAEMHGGALEIDSEPGKGSTVTVTMPADRVLPMSAARVA